MPNHRYHVKGAYKLAQSLAAGYECSACGAQMDVDREANKMVLNVDHAASCPRRAETSE